MRRAVFLCFVFREDRPDEYTVSHEQCTLVPPKKRIVCTIVYSYVAGHLPSLFPLPVYKSAM